MRAEEAKKLSDSKKETLEEIVKRIEQMANSGYSDIVSQILHPDAIPELMRLGYKVSIHKEPMGGLESHVVSW